MHIKYFSRITFTPNLNIVGVIGSERSTNVILLLNISIYFVTLTLNQGHLQVHISKGLVSHYIFEMFHNCRVNSVRESVNIQIYGGRRVRLLDGLKPPEGHCIDSICHAIEPKMTRNVKRTR